MPQNLSMPKDGAIGRAIGGSAVSVSCGMKRAVLMLMLQYKLYMKGESAISGLRLARDQQHEKRAVGDDYKMYIKIKSTPGGSASGVSCAMG